MDHAEGEMGRGSGGDELVKKWRPPQATVDGRLGRGRDVHVDFGAMPQKIFISPRTTSTGREEQRGSEGGPIIYRFLTVSREKAKTNHKFCGPIAVANYAANKWPIMKRGALSAAARAAVAVAAAAIGAPWQSQHLSSHIPNGGKFCFMGKLGRKKNTLE